MSNEQTKNFRIPMKYTQGGVEKTMKILIPVDQLMQLEGHLNIKLHTVDGVVKPFLYAIDNTTRLCILEQDYTNTPETGTMGAVEHHNDA